MSQNKSCDKIHAVNYMNVKMNMISIEMSTWHFLPNKNGSLCALNNSALLNASHGLGSTKQNDY